MTAHLEQEFNSSYENLLNSNQKLEVAIVYSCYLTQNFLGTLKVTEIDLQRS